MARPPDPIDDRTPLDGARIDVAARIGWLLRTHRTAGGLSLREMSTELAHHGIGLSTSTLSRIESEGQRSPLALDGYARVLGLPDGLLWSAVEHLANSFPYGPAALPDPAEPRLETFSSACDAVAVSQPSAGAWLEFGRQHARADGFGLPTSLMQPLVERLADEVGRAVGTARFLRYQAILQLLRSPYGDLVTVVLCRRVDDPDHQNFYDLTGTVCDRPTPGLLHWAGALLSHPSVFHARGGSYVLQGMLVVGGLGLDTWRELVPHLEGAWQAAAGDPERVAILAQVCRALPHPLQAELHGIGIRPGRPQPPVAWSRTRDNVHYAFATRVARAACTRLGLPDEPLLERLLFEAFFEPRGVRMSTSAWHVANSPFADALVHAIIEARDSCPDPASRAASLRVAALCHAGGDVPAGVADLLEGVDEEFIPAVTILGRSGQALPDAALERGLRGSPAEVRQTLYGLGMAGDPRLSVIAQEPDLPPATARAARWWLGQGSRILA